MLVYIEVAVMLAPFHPTVGARLWQLCQGGRRLAAGPRDRLYVAGPRHDPLELHRRDSGGAPPRSGALPSGGDVSCSLPTAHFCSETWGGESIRQQYETPTDSCAPLSGPRLPL